MSGGGLVVIENGSCVVDAKMPCDRFFVQQDPVDLDAVKIGNGVGEISPRALENVISNCVSQPEEKHRNKENGTITDISPEEQKNQLSDDGDHEKPVPDDIPEPDEELRNKLIKQVEFYFSDANILKDVFLLKHVRRTKDGFVSLKLIASFKKMKSLTKDIRVVARCLRHSEQLDVNKEGTKVKRKNPLPEHDETVPFRTVVAMNFGSKDPTIESVTEQFSKCGDITLIRIIRPGRNIAADLSKYASKHPEIGTTTCAVIEFEKREHAKTACDTMTNTLDWRNGMRVVMLDIEKKKKDKQTKNSDEASPDEDATEDGTKKKKRRNKQKMMTHVDKQSENNSSQSQNGTSSDDGSGNMQRSGDTSHQNSPSGSSPRTQQRRSLGKSASEAPSQNGVHRSSPRNSPETSRSKPGESSASRLRHLRSPCEVKGGESPGGSPSAGRRPLGLKSSKLPGLVGVLRQPKGPDDSKGFGKREPRTITVT